MWKTGKTSSLDRVLHEVGVDKSVSRRDKKHNIIIVETIVD